MSWLDFDTQWEHIKNPFNMKNASKAFKQIDPVIGYGVPAVFKAEDKFTSKLWRTLGVDSLADWSDKDANDEGRAIRNRGLAGLAALGGMWAGAGAGAGGGTAAGSSSGWLGTVGQGLGAANSAKGLMATNEQPVQQGQIANQAPDFSGLLAASTQQDAQRQQEQLMRKQQQNQIMQGLLGAQYGR